VTSKQLKRGNNFGVVYFTNNTLEEEMENKTKQIGKIGIKNQSNTMSTDIRQKNMPDRLVPPISSNLKHTSMHTDQVTSTIRPTPLRFEIEVQTDDYIDRPVL